jgi:uncharacterized protein YndB with AHSA1/START domain
MAARETVGTLSETLVWERKAAIVSYIEGEIIIHRPVEGVFDFVTDEARYNRRMLRAEKSSEGPLGPGTRFQVELDTMGRTTPMSVEFTDYDRPRRVASCTRSSMMTTDGTLSFEPIALAGP